MLRLLLNPGLHCFLNIIIRRDDVESFKWTDDMIIVWSQVRTVRVTKKTLQTAAVAFASTSVPAACGRAVMVHLDVYF